MQERPVSWADYLVFGLSLSISVCTGLYQAIASAVRRRRAVGDGEETEEEYMLGGRHMPSLPVMLSLLATFQSGILMLAYPGEIYGTHRLRRIYSVVFIVSIIVYMGIVLYTPSVAIAEAIDIDKRILIAVFCASTTLYTALGGLKAVVWADALQAVIMYGGVVSVIIGALLNERVGGISNVFSLAWKTGRIQETWRIHPSLLQHHSLWINAILYSVTTLQMYSVNQLSMQRYASMATLKQAQSMIHTMIIPYVVLSTVVVFVGFLALAYFYNCDPLLTGRSDVIDHVIISFAKDVLEPYPGLFGLYVSCVMSATVSTLSSGYNSLAAVIYEDFLKSWLENKIRPGTVTLISKILVVLIALLSAGFAYAAEFLGGSFRMSQSIVPGLNGAMVGVCVLAFFYPNVNELATIIAFVVSLVITSTISIIGYIEEPYHAMFHSTGVTDEKCANWTGAALNLSRPALPYDPHWGEPSASFVSKISNFSYGFIGVAVVLMVGWLLGGCLREENTEKFWHMTFYGRWLPMPEKEKKKEKTKKGRYVLTIPIRQDES